MRDLPHDQEPELVPYQTNLSPQCRILVVDDDPLLRLLLARALMACGFHVDVAEDGEAAWNALNANCSYDLLVTDNNMPNLSGIELLKKLHAARIVLPVILVSGAMPTDELHCHPWLKIDARLDKPFSVDELVDAVATVLRLTNEDREQMESACG